MFVFRLEMTRFARAFGSKSSNARAVEEATSWADMKQQLLDNQSTSSDSKSDEIEQKIKKIKKSLSAVDKQQLATEWAKFGNDQLLKPDYLSEIAEEPVENSKKKKVSKVKDVPSAEVKSEEEAVPKREKKKKKKKEAQVSQNVQKSAIKTSKQGAEEAKSQPQKQKKRRAEKQLEGTEAKRRKPMQNKIYFEGREIEVDYVDGFPVLKDDASRLRDLRKKMLNEGIPKSEVNKAMKLERRRAEKALSRETKKVCFNCRQPGHMMSACPKMSSGDAEMCFKCGSTEHKSPQCKVTQGDDYKFSKCFVCGESGHISRQCPDNPRGLYPQGGGCRMCGDVTHLKKDCPQLTQDKKDNTKTLSTAKDFAGVESLEESRSQMTPSTINVPKKNKIIKF
jgi:zinc finger CCHC domain-containing protein 9